MPHCHLLASLQVLSWAGLWLSVIGGNLFTSCMLLLLPSMLLFGFLPSISHGWEQTFVFYLNNWFEARCVCLDKKEREVWDTHKTRHSQSETVIKNSFPYVFPSLTSHPAKWILSLPLPVFPSLISSIPSCYFLPEIGFYEAQICIRLY